MLLLLLLFVEVLFVGTTTDMDVLLVVSNVVGVVGADDGGPPAPATCVVFILALISLKELAAGASTPATIVGSSLLELHPMMFLFSSSFLLLWFAGREVWIIDRFRSYRRCNDFNLVLPSRSQIQPGCHVPSIIPIRIARYSRTRNKIE